MSKFQNVRKKPVTVQALLWDGSKEAISSLNQMGCVYRSQGDGSLTIHTLEGWIIALPGDYIIRGVKKEFYPCKPEIFKLTYDVE